MTAGFRVQCVSTDDRDEKTGEPRSWGFDVDTRELAQNIASIQSAPCSLGCCAGAVVTIVEVSRG